ncbi:hypothetical protein B0H10DRAFT_2233367 [Mycena sp. CBHHK59/15]|nr:hypothetical protein B0H10DRAFT_2233367 [Mycena sp. CBHHK59/15]
MESLLRAAPPPPPCLDNDYHTLLSFLCFFAISIIAACITQAKPNTVVLSTILFTLP